MAKKLKKIESFNLEPGTMVAGKYKVLGPLGSGWEGEVYKIVETRTGIERAAKFFYPHRNRRDRISRRYARKLHKLRHCPILIQYHTEETFEYDGVDITVLVSEYVEGIMLSEFLRGMPGGRLVDFEALHLLYALVKGIEQIHLKGEYHGDLHLDNVIISRYGLTFELKVLDFFHWEATKAENRQTDVCDLVRIFYDCLGGRRHYARQPDAVKYIISGLKRSLIIRKFRTVTHLRKHLETMQW
jgi:tRNA A-37 threonylcarbamoyl transferase component Bud32